LIERDSVDFEGVKTEILVAWIFALIALVGWIIGFLFYLWNGLAYLAVLSGWYGFSYLPYIGVYAAGLSVGFLITLIVFVVMMIPTIFVFQRISRMRGAANRDDVDQLRKLNSVGWAIVALIFSAIIPGIILLIAHSPIERLSTVTPMTAGASMMDLERISRLKSMLDTGVITKEEFESQKSLILHPSSTQPSAADPLQTQLVKLKSLYDSGAITETEYEQQKRKLLSEI
jgi:hypothetical protein